MAEPDKPGKMPATIECAVCKKQIPASAAVSPEADEYALYFCGGECHAQWEREHAAEIARSFADKGGVKL